MVKIWGHRGCKGEREGSKGSNPPENSLASFGEAIKQGADGFELDVFLTKDNKLVVFHDDTLERMSNGAGNITDYTLTELRSLRLKDNKGQLTELQIPTLDEVLDLADKAREQTPAFTVNIEIKEDVKGRNIAREVSDAIESRLQQGWTTSNFQVSSFDMGSLRKMKEAKPEIPRGALFEGPIPPVAPWDISEELLAQRLQENADLVKGGTVNITLPSMTPKAVGMIKAVGATPVAWTSGEVSPDILMQGDKGRATARRILDSGLDAMITDYPEEMRKLLAMYASKTESRAFD